MRPLPGRQAYRQIDEQTAEWTGLPGWRDPDYAANFFSPLPRQAWSSLAPSQLITSTLSSKAPLGWGAFPLEDWRPGQQITFSRSPVYFRAAEGLPRFDRLVFQFFADPGQAVLALQQGQCDILDPSFGLAPDDPRLAPLLAAGEAAALEIPAVAREHLDFGINPAVN